MITLIIGFWLCAALVVYTYVGYPLLLRPRPAVPAAGAASAGLKYSVSFVVCAHNEEESIWRRLEELLNQIDASELHGEIIFVSDGSTDGSASIGRTFTSDRVHVLELEKGSGQGRHGAHAGRRAVPKRNPGLRRHPAAWDAHRPWPAAGELCRP